MNSSVWVEIEQGPIDEVTKLNPPGRQKCSPPMGENHTEPSVLTKNRKIEIHMEFVALRTQDRITNQIQVTEIRTTSTVGPNMTHLLTNNRNLDRIRRS